MNELKRMAAALLLAWMAGGCASSPMATRSQGTMTSSAFVAWVLESTHDGQTPEYVQTLTLGKDGRGIVVATGADGDELAKMKIFYGVERQRRITAMVHEQESRDPRFPPHRADEEFALDASVTDGRLYLATDNERFRYLAGTYTRLALPTEAAEPVANDDFGG